MTDNDKKAKDVEELSDVSGLPSSVASNGDESLVLVSKGKGGVDHGNRHWISSDTPSHMHNVDAMEYA